MRAFAAGIVVVVAVMGFWIGSAGADEIFIAGFTNGCFGAACAPGTSAITGGLTYSNSTFQGTTAAGFRAVGGNPNPGSNFNNLGSMSLSVTPQSYNTSFTLQTTFTAPQGITGSNSATMTATVTGTVISDNIGGVLIDFNNTPLLFTFSDTNCEVDPTGGIPGQQTTCGAGAFSFSVNDVSIDPGQTAAVTGQFTAAQQSSPLITPEPATFLMVGTAGVLLAIRRRRNSHRADRSQPRDAGA